jgi:xanthine dehydrogenase small subunit
MSSRPIQFFHRGQIIKVSDVSPTRTVLDWLREDAKCRGTKEGCNEGDCGACTIVVGELAKSGDPNAVRGLSLQTVNACIKFLPTLDGKALFTVEDLKQDGELHPVQQAMVDCHGSQCGFCTPGIVMSLWNNYEHHLENDTRPTRQRLADDLSGNLCRCTGYRPILDAGLHMFELPEAKLDTSHAVAALRELSQSTDLFEYERQGTRFLAPRSLEELARLREELPKAQLLSGSTDVGLWVTKQFRTLGDLLYVGQVEELKRIEQRGNHLWIGAGASLENAWRALAQRWPDLTDVWLRFSSLPVRYAGTMGGNVANGSPIGDSPPILMALDAEIELRKGERIRRMPLSDFYIDYMKNHLEAGELVQAILIPTLSNALQVRGYKISKRFDCDISALCMGAAIELVGSTITTVRLAFGGMAGTVKRARAAEQALLGKEWSKEVMLAAQSALANDFTPLSDMRASNGYRELVARNLLRRFWLETRAVDPLPAGATSVYASLPHDVA